MGKLVKFHYKKLDGSHSNREIFAVSYPYAEQKNAYMGYDISEFSEAEKDYYALELIKLSEQLAAEKRKLDEEFNEKVKRLGLGSNFKKFLVSGMSDIEEE